MTKLRNNNAGIPALTPTPKTTTLILQAVRLMRGTADTRPEKIYLRFQQMLARVASQRN